MVVRVPVPVGRTVTSSLCIPLRIIYRCSSCGGQNINEAQTLNVSASVNGSLFSNREKLRTESQKLLMSNLHGELQSLADGHYKKARFKCVCKYCGNKEPWTQYVDSSRIVLYLLILLPAFLLMGFSFMMPLLTMANIFRLIAVALAMVSLSLVVSSLAKNIRLDRLIRRLPDENKPYIEILDPQINDILQRLKTSSQDMIAKYQQQTVIPVRKNNEMIVCPLCGLEQLGTRESCARCQCKFSTNDDILD